MAVESVTAEFAKQPSDDASHHQNGNKDRDQRHANGEDRKANLLGTLQCR